MTYAWPDALLIVLVLSNFMLLGSSRLHVYIRISALQGVLLGLLPMLEHMDQPGTRVATLVILGAVTIALKGAVFPYLLLRALREANVLREAEPFVGYTSSVMVGLAALGIALRVSARLPAPAGSFSNLAVPVALFTIFIGLFLIVSRRKALTQVLGYLVLENGAFVLGLALAAGIPAMVELGVLLDAFVAVLVMQIAIHHISQEFRSTDVDRLTTLKG